MTTIYRSVPLVSYKFIRFGAMDVTKPYEFIGFGAMDVTKPYKFIGFGAMDVTKTYQFIGFGAWCAPGLARVGCRSGEPFDRPHPLA